MNRIASSVAAAVLALVAVTLAPSSHAIAADQVRDAALTAFGDFRDQVAAVLDGAVVPPDVAEALEDALKDAHAALRSSNVPAFASALSSFSLGVSNPSTVNILGPTVAAGLVGGELHIVEYLGAIHALTPDQVSEIVLPLQSVLIGLLGS